MKPLAALDSLLVTAELLGSPVHVGAVLILTPPPDADPGYLDDLYLDSLVGSHEIDPRLRRYPHRGLDTGGMWMWREAGEVDLRAHLRRATLPPGAGLAGLWRLVSELHSERLDLGAPLWRSWLIEGLPEGRFALYIKIHHTVIDGVGGLQMIGDALSTDPDRRSMAPFYTATRPGGQAGHRRWLPNPLAAVRAVAGAAVAGVNLTRRVAAAELAIIVGSVLSDPVQGPLAAPHTRFNAKLGPRRAAAGSGLDRSRVRAVATAAGVTTNDAVTAVIAGALRHWLLANGELPERTLVAMCPVSVRSHDEQGAIQGGNRFGLGLCPLGTDIADDAERLTLIHRAMTAIKRQVSQRGSDAMLAVMAPAIGSTVLQPLLGLENLVPPSCNLAISNVPGPREVCYYNGSRLDDIFPVSTAFDGMGLNVTVCGYADRIEVGYVTDAEIMPGVADLVALTEAALTELEAAVVGIGEAGR